MYMDEREEKDIYRLVRDNNRMLRAIRRNAILWGIIKIIFYVGIVVILPLWLYSTYLAPIAEQAQGVLNQVQGVSDGAQSQVNSLQEFLKQFFPTKQ